MIKWLFTQSAMKIYCSLLLFAPLISFTQQRYNVIKDSGFENNDTIWVGYKSDAGLYVDRHYPSGYESKWCGLTDASGLIFGTVAYCYLEQKLVKRAVKDYNLEKNVRYFIQTWPTPASYNCWYVTIGGQKNRLIFFYHGYPENLPVEDESTHVVDLGLPKVSTYQSWEPETLNFYKNWTAKFPETDTIGKLRFTSFQYIGGPGVLTKGQKVWWDNIIFESTRPDSDASMVDIGFSGNPTAKVQNKGAVAVSFPTICKIFKNGTTAYTDTVQIDSLAVDSIKQIIFKPYSDTGNMIIYTALPGDQNPSNDTLTKNLGVQEIVAKKPIPFQVWPTLTRGMVNYDSDKPVIVFDPTGRLVQISKSGKGSFILEHGGIYFVKSGREVKKIIRLE